MSPLGGAVFAIERPNQKDKAVSLPRDSSHLPLASRLALYVMKMLVSGATDVIEPQLQSTLFLYLPLAVQLIEDDISMEGSTAILPLDALEARSAFVELVSRTRHHINQWIHNSDAIKPLSDDEVNMNALSFWRKQLEQLQGNAPMTYRIAEAYTKVMSEGDALGKVSFAESSFNLAQKLDGPSNPFVMVAVIAALRGSLATVPAALTLCNQLVAQATGLDELTEAEGQY